MAGARGAGGPGRRSRSRPAGPPRGAGGARDRAGARRRGRSSSASAPGQRSAWAVPSFSARNPRPPCFSGTSCGPGPATCTGASARSPRARRCAAASSADGRWRAAVELRETYDPGRGIMDVVFQVTPGPRMTLEVRGATLPSQAPRGRARARARGRSDERQPRGGGGADRDTPAGRGLPGGRPCAPPRSRARPERRSCTSCARARAPPSPAWSSGAPRPSSSRGLRTQPGRPLVDAALEEDARAPRLAPRGAAGTSRRASSPRSPEEGGRLDVVFLAQPGPRALVTGVDVEGPPLPPSGDDRGPEELALRPGPPYRLRDVARSRDTLLTAWRRAGYLDARVRARGGALRGPRRGAGDAWWSSPARARSSSTSCSPASAAPGATVVEREMALRPGEPFSFERVLESQRRLSGLGIFERVTIAELDPERERRRDVVVSVQEAPAHELVVGGGLLRAGPPARQRRAHPPEPRRPRPHRVRLRPRELPRAAVSSSTCASRGSSAASSTRS